MRRMFLLTGLFLLLMGNLQAQSGADSTSTAKSSAELPVKRVVLYKNGVGYFEHAGRVAGSQELNIQFTTGQLNDVLKSLTVVDLGGGKITGVRYNSIAPLSERLGTLRLRLGEQTTRVDFLNALRGARVEVRNGTVSAIGKLLSVEISQRQIGKGEILQVPQVAIVTDSGELRSFDLTPTTTVRIAEGELNQEIGRYLNLIGSSRAKDMRRMTISTSGTGDREVFVSYISEVPVWKSTYRIVLPKDPKNKPLLQGWAIVDNTIGEDWKDVQLSLVAGAPQSFVEQISQPLYVRRPTVALPETAQLSPQTHEGTMEESDDGALVTSTSIPKKIAMIGEEPSASPVGVIGGIGSGSGGGIGGGVYRTAGGNAFLRGRVTDPQGAVIPGVRVTVVNKQTGATSQAVSDPNGNYFVPGSAGDNSVSFDAPGFSKLQFSKSLYANTSNELNPTLNVGSVQQTVEVTDDSASNATSNSANAYIAKRSSGISADAEGKAMGDLFEYALQQKITVLKNQSALVPIVQAPIAADRVTLWNSEVDQALRALWVTNTTGLTLDSGTFNIIEGDAFAGEGLVNELRPNERRLLSYAADTAVRVDSESNADEQPYTRITIAHGLMKLTREERNTTTYRIRNTDTQARDVVIEHPVEQGWILAEGEKPEESSSSFHRFRVKVESGKTAQLAVSEFRPQETQYVISNITNDQLLLFVKEKAIKPELEQSLRAVLSKKAEISGVDLSILSRRQEINRISQEQNRLRENMKALKGGAEEKALLQRYVQQLNRQEDRLTTLNNEINDWESKRTELSAELDRMVQKITMDEKL